MDPRVAARTRRRGLSISGRGAEGLTPEAPGSTGDVTDVVVPVTATQWTDNNDAQYLWPGAWSGNRSRTFTCRSGLR